MFMHICCLLILFERLLFFCERLLVVRDVFWMFLCHNRHKSLLFSKLQPHFIFISLFYQHRMIISVHKINFKNFCWK